MSATNGNSFVENGLPIDGVSADGLFLPVKNILDNTFDEETNESEPAFNENYWKAENIVGSREVPYLPSALPAYIPTLFNNIRNIGVNLKNEIPSETVPDNREYPTIYAVKKYVETQLSGSETKSAGGASEVSVSTGISNTALIGAPLGLTTSVPNCVVRQDGEGSYFLTNFFDIDQIDEARLGATKFIINTSELSNQYMMMIQLKGTKFFSVSGKKYKNYQFSTMGDVLQLIQSVVNGETLFFVISYGGIFSN